MVRYVHFLVKYCKASALDLYFCFKCDNMTYFLHQNVFAFAWASIEQSVTVSTRIILQEGGLQLTAVEIRRAKFEKER